MKRLFLLLPLVLAACGPAQPDKATKPRPLESQHQALEQAKGLEQQLQQQADAQKQAIQQQIDGPPS